MFAPDSYLTSLSYFMPAKHSRNGRSARQRLPRDNALFLHSPSVSLSDVDELTAPYSATPETASNDSPAPTLSTLIDFDQAPQIPNQVQLEVVDPSEDLAIGHRSPPFIQAPLPPIDDILTKDSILHSPKPLPTRPRIALADSAFDPSLGHTRSPILAR